VTKTVWRICMSFPVIWAGAFGRFCVAQQLPYDLDRFGLKVRDDFYAGYAGDRVRFDRAMKMCDEALAKDPGNSEALVWHGNGLLFMGGRAARSGDPNQGKELSERGLKEMQAAVDLTPDNEAVRVIRGATLETVARTLQNQDEARKLLRLAVADYEHTREIQATYFDKMPEHGRGELLLGLADGYSRLGDVNRAKSLFEQIRASLPGTVYASSATEWLAKKTPLPAAKAGCLGCHTGN